MSEVRTSHLGAAPTPAPVLRGEVATPPVFVWIVSLPVRLLDAAIWLYQKTASPALNALNPHCGCRFAPTCSHYAREALREHGLITGVALTVVRLAKCGPWHPGGLDPVPPRRAPICRSVPRNA